jgi:hypothetical protein
MTAPVAWQVQPAPIAAVSILSGGKARLEITAE